MTERKWLYQPGEMTTKGIGQSMELSGSKLNQFVTLTEEYSELYPSQRTLVLNDNKDIVFFVQLNDSATGTKRTDVFIWNGEQYLAASPGIALELSKTYFDYLDVVALAYQHLEGETNQ